MAERMVARKIFLPACLGLLLGLAAPDAVAQPRFEYRSQVLSFQQRVSRISWQLDFPDHREKIAQSYLPTSFDFAVARNSHLLISTAGGWSSAGLPADYEMNGVTDTQVRFSQRLADRWLIGAGVN